MRKTIELRKRTKVDGEIYYDIVIDGWTKNCFLKLEEAEQYYEKLKNGLWETIEVLKAETIETDK